MGENDFSSSFSLNSILPKLLSAVTGSKLANYAILKSMFHTKAAILNKMVSFLMQNNDF